MGNTQIQEQEVTAPVKPLRNAEIDAHALLDRDQRALCKVMRNTAPREFRMYDFVCIALHATASDCTNVDDDNISARVVAETALHRAAILYVYEALKTCDIGIIKEWPEFDEMLRSLVTLAGDLP